ncbi:MAG: c-type cytochrome biogenesis protein CcmI, partial [Spongiibacter sp.]
MELYFGIGALSLLAIGFCALALRQPPQHNDTQLRRGAQRTFYQQRVAELQAERDAATITAEQFDELRGELDLQLLAENSDTSSAAERAARGPIIATLVLVPVLAWLLYDYLGYQRDLALRDMQKALITNAEPTREDLAEFENLVTEILERRPDNAQLLIMMAGIRRQQGNYVEAVPYYRELQRLYPKDADVLAQLAQARYLAQNRQLDKESAELLSQALAINPDQGTALGVLGIDAFGRGDFASALNYWQRLLPQLPANSSEARVIASGVAAAKEKAIAAGTLEGISVDLNIDTSLGSVPASVLFVVAKSNDGNPMPVAALRIPLAAGESPPSTVHLTDGDVIRQGQTLKDFEALSLAAHLSMSGTAIRR